MAEFAALVRWLVTYSVTGGFFHFLGVWLTVLALTRILWFVRVKVEVRRKARRARQEAQP